MRTKKLLGSCLIVSLLICFACGSKEEEKPDPKIKNEALKQKAIRYFKGIKEYVDPIKEDTNALFRSINSRNPGTMESNFQQLEQTILEAVDYVENLDVFENDDSYRLAVLAYLEFNRGNLYELYSPMVADFTDIANGVSDLSDEDLDQKMEEMKARAEIEEVEIDKFDQAQEAFAKLYGFRVQ